MTVSEWLSERGIKLRNSRLIEEAFTHTSYLNENRQALHDNERLEFMGDAVLEIWFSERLFKVTPPLNEGEMTTLRARMVCARSFASIMRSLDLAQFIKLGKGEEKNGGRDKESILEDTFEAFIGALYLTEGIKAVDKLLNPLFDEVFAKAREEVMDYKSKLQEYVQADIRKAVRYVLLSEKGPANSPVFEIGVYLDDVLLGKGTGHNKKQAEQAAAREALDKMVK